MIKFALRYLTRLLWSLKKALLLFGEKLEEVGLSILRNQRGS